MKRNILFFLVIVLAFANANAQIVKPGNKEKIKQDIKSGIKSTLDVIDQDSHPTGTHELWDIYVAPQLGIGISALPGGGGIPEVGITGGGFVEVFVRKNLAIDVGLNFSHQGGNNVAYDATVTDADGNSIAQGQKYDYNLNYINTDYLCRWYPWSYKTLSVYTGLHLARLVHAKSKLHDGAITNIRRELHKGDVAIPVGISYEWKQWQLDGRFFYSLRHIARTDKAKMVLGNATNTMLSVTVAYKIQVF